MILAVEANGLSFSLSFCQESLLCQHASRFASNTTIPSMNAARLGPSPPLKMDWMGLADSKHPKDPYQHLVRVLLFVVYVGAFQLAEWKYPPV